MKQSEAVSFFCLSHLQNMLLVSFRVVNDRKLKRRDHASPY